MHLTDLHLLFTALSQSLSADPFLSLCQVVAWLDPLQEQDFDWDEVEYGDEVATMTLAWQISRQCFPEVYADTTLALRQNVFLATLSEQMCEGFNRHLSGGQLADLEQIHFGLPFYGMGVNLTDPDFWEDANHTQLRKVCAWFGLEHDEDTAYHQPDPYYQAARVAHVLAQSLRQVEVTSFQNVAWLLDWLFSQTGNTCLDYTDDDFFEMGVDPLSWELDDITFSNAMHTEAAEIIQQAYTGLDFLLSDAVFQTRFRMNLTFVSDELSKKEKPDDRDFDQLTRRLRWVADPDDIAAN